MKIQKTLLFSILIALSCMNLFAQQDSVKKTIVFRTDTLIVGNYYTFFIQLKSPIMGKLLTLEEDNFLVYNDKDIDEIDTSRIIKVLDAANYIYSEYKDSKRIGNNEKYIFIGAGYLFSRPAKNPYNRYNDGFNLNLSYMITFSDFFGLRTDLDYNHMSRKDETYSYIFSGQYSWYSYTGGTSNNFLFRTNAVVGSINPKHIIQVYFMPALGTGFSINTQRNYSSSYNNGPVTTSSYGGGFNFCLGVSLGAGLNVKLSKKLRGFTEIQYNAWVLGENGPPEFSALKFGIIL